MGRSVSTPTDATDVTYVTTDDWAVLVDRAMDAFAEMAPDGWHEDRWIGREDHVLWADYNHLYGLSEYMGLVAIWRVRQDTDGKQWEDVIADYFPDRLTQIGRFSNGEAVYRRESE